MRRVIFAALAVALAGCGPPVGDTARVSLSGSTAQPLLGDFAGFGGWYSPAPRKYVAQVESADTGEVLVFSFATGAFPLDAEIGGDVAATLALGFADGRPLWQAESGTVSISGDPASRLFTVAARDLVLVAASTTATGTARASADGTFQAYPP